jgi:hypothetical protein
MRKYVIALVMLLVGLTASDALAQAADTTRVVGRKGAKQLSLSFSTTTQMKTTPRVRGVSSTSTSTNMFGAIDFGRFVTDRFVLAFGISGSGNVGEGSTPMFYGNGGAAFYFSPQKSSSLYVGGDVSSMLTQLEGVEMKPEVVGKIGLQTALKENASIFIEGAYGGAVDALATNGSLRTRLGLRVLF